MANGLNDIIIKIKAQFDDKSLEKSMSDYTRKVADNTKVNLNKTIENTQTSISKSAKAIQSDLNALTKNSMADMFTRAADAVTVFNNRVAEIGKADSIDTATAKVYKLEQRLNTTAQSILKLQSDFNRISESETAKEGLLSQFGDLDKAKAAAGDLLVRANKINDMMRRLGADSGPGNLKPMQELAAQIDAIKEKLRGLKTERASMDTRSDKGTEQWTADLQALDSEIAKATSKVGTLSKEFYKLGRNANFGKTKEEIRDTFDLADREVELRERAAKIAHDLRLALEQKGPQQITTLTSLADAGANFEELINKIRALAEEMAKVDEESNKVDEDVKKIGNSANKTGFSFNQWRNVVWSFSRLLGNVYTIGLDIVRGAKQIANFYVKIWNTAKKVLSTLKQWRKHITGTANEHGKSFKQMLKDLIRYSLGIRSLFALFRRLRTYIKEAFSAMAAQIPEVNAMLASLKSSLYALKGSLATAFEPILSAIAPALVKLIDLLAQAVTYIGMFFAALTGRSYVYKANKVAQTIGKAAGAAKELNKQLQGFDELNNLTTNKGGGGGGGDTPLAQFEKVDVPDWIKNLAQQLQDLWDRIIKPIKDAWAKVGDYVVEAWKRAFNSIKDLLYDIGRDFLTVWDKMGEHIAEMFFRIIGDIGNIIANIADKIREAWNFVEDGQTESNGIRFWTAILGIVDAILTGVHKITDDIKNWTAEINITPAMTAFVHWLESLVPIVKMVMEILYQFWDRALKPILTWAFDGENSGIARFFQILADFNNKLDKQKIIDDLNKIWDALGRFGINIGEGLLMFMERMLGYLADWLNSDDFTQWCQDVADFLDGLKPEDLADDLEQVWRIIKNIANELWTAIKYVIDHKDQILDFLEWCSKHLKEIAAIFIGGKLAIDFARFIANLLLAGGAISKFVGGLSSASGLIASIGSALPIILAVVAAVGLLVAAYGGVGEVVERVKKTILDVYDKVKKKSEDLGLPKKIQDLKDSLKKLGESFDKILVPIQKVLVKFGLLGETSTGLKGAFEIMFAYITVVFTALFTCVATQITSIIAVITDAINFVSGIVQIVSGVFELIVGIITFDGQKIKEGATDIWEGVKTTFSSGIKFVKDLFKGFIDAILAPFKAIKYALVGDPIVIDMWEEIKRVFDESIGKVIEFVNKLKEKVIELFQNLKEKIDEKIKAIKDKFKEFADDIQRKKEDIANKLTELKTKFAEKFDEIKSKVQEKVQDVKSKLTELVSKFTEIKNDISEALSNIASKIGEKLNEAKGKIDTFKSNISTALNNIKDTFVKAFENIKEGIKTPINGALGFVEKFVNGVIRAINRLGDKLGDFEFDIPDALADKFDLPTNFKIDIPRLSEISIPRLAQGAVIPPNKEFLAVLGDQKRGTNIETPLDTMVEAFNMANRGGNEQELRLLQEQNDLLRQLLNKEFGISERQIYNSVINQDNIRRKSTGSSAFAY